MNFNNRKWKLNCIRRRTLIRAVSIVSVGILTLWTFLMCSKNNLFAVQDDRNAGGKVTEWILTQSAHFFAYDTEHISMDHDVFSMAMNYVQKQAFPNLYYTVEAGTKQERDVEGNEVPPSFYEDENEKESDQQVVKALEEPLTDLATTNQGVQYREADLNDFNYLLSHFYVVDSNTELKSSDIDCENFRKKDLHIDWNSKEYKILIYHTHGSEDFIDSRKGKTEDTIIGAGETLTKILEETYGVHVYHDTTVYDVIDGKLDRSLAYKQSGKGVDEILEKYPSIDVVIDLHRDGVSEDTHLVTTINGKPTAQIMLFNGISRSKTNGEISYLKNPNVSDNLAFSLQMYIAGTQMYDNYMRRIFVRSYRYNLDRKGRALLIEAGAQTNTVEEEKNAMEPLAAILYKVLSGKK